MPLRALSLIFALILSMPLVVFAERSAGNLTLVRTQDEYAAAVSKLKPGSSIILADGIWRDFQIVFSGKGLANRPITLTAQTPGKVILSGQSNLRLSGEYLQVSNLVFRDGWSPTGEVVSFRRTRAERANFSRVTGVVIDRFNKPDRAESDNWVAMYGHHNQFDHNHLIGKNNTGTTLVVVRDEEQGLDNRHLIHKNWFGPRPNLGANGGETIRVGTSHDSLSDSHTRVEENWFEGCDGEVEIISNKSGANTYRGNVFMRSRGALVLRHGDGNLVEDNVFFGEGQAHTGGIRVINRKQTIRNNYMEGLAGEGFASALTIMYGVPNSPLNRYTQVDQVVIENNTIINPHSVFFGAGKDTERSAAPIASKFARNLVINTNSRDPVRVLGDLSGITFADNQQSPAASKGFPKGVTSSNIKMTRAATGLLVSDAADTVGARRDLRPIAREQVGISWYPKESASRGLDSGSTQSVSPGEDTLTTAIAKASAGDRLELAAGRYVINQLLVVNRPLTVQGPEKGEALIVFSRPTLFEIEAGGLLKLSRLSVSGSLAPDNVGNAVVRTRPGSGAANFALIIENTRIFDLNVNRGFDVISMGKQTMADRITLRGVTIENVSGTVVSAAAERDDRGTYNAEVVEVENSLFRHIDAAVIDLYRGGTDESTFGPKLRVEASSFEQAGKKSDASLRLHGVQHATLSDNRFVDSSGVHFAHTVGEPKLIAARNVFSGTPAIVADVTLESVP